MVECICDYAEARLLSTMGGMNKDKKNIIHYIGQIKVQTKNIAELQEKHHNCQPSLDISGSPSSNM